RRERCRRVMIADALLPRAGGRDPQVQRPVARIARAPKRPCQYGWLLGGRREPAAVRAFLSHAYHSRKLIISEQSKVLVASWLRAPAGARRFSPKGKPRVLRAAVSDHSCCRLTRAHAVARQLDQELIRREDTLCPMRTSHLSVSARQQDTSDGKRHTGVDIARAYSPGFVWAHDHPLPQPHWMPLAAPPRHHAQHVAVLRRATRRRLMGGQQRHQQFARRALHHLAPLWPARRHWLRATKAQIH